MTRTHPFASFALLAYAISWAAWSLAIAFPGTIAATLGFYAGGFGPLLAALLVLHRQGRALWPWFRGLFHWRVAPGWYAFAILFPALLMAVASAAFLATGGTLTPALLPERLVQYLPTLVVMALIGGGNEEPGWRGFGLPHLQRRFSPLAATFLLGLVWAFWHLPLLGTSPGALAAPAGEIATRILLLLVSITAHAFWYTWLINRTGSVLLCILLHAGYNATNGLLLLVPVEAMHGDAEARMLPIMTAVVVGSAVLLTLATRGRLGGPARRPAG